MNPIDAHLDEVTVMQMTWKPGPCLTIAAAICRAALSASGTLWPDEIKFEVASTDKNCVGTAWRRLAKFEVIEETGAFRRSESETAHGRRVFEYRVKSVKRARRFLELNHLAVPEAREQQMELVT